MPVGKSGKYYANPSQMRAYGDEEEGKREDARVEDDKHEDAGDEKAPGDPGEHLSRHMEIHDNGDGSFKTIAHATPQMHDGHATPQMHGGGIEGEPEEQEHNSLDEAMNHVKAKMGGDDEDREEAQGEGEEAAEEEPALPGLGRSTASALSGA